LSSAFLFGLGVFRSVSEINKITAFIATDICRVANGRIAENWHFEEILH
jgi:hypothetical protein